MRHTAWLGLRTIVSGGLTYIESDDPWLAAGEGGIIAPTPACSVSSEKSSFMCSSARTAARTSSRRRSTAGRADTACWARRNPNSFTASTLAIAVFVLLLIEWVYPTRLITPGYALLLGVITVGLGMLLAGPRGWGIACLVLGGLLVATSILPFAVEVRTPHVHEPISPPSGFGFEMVKGANPAIQEYRATAYDGRPDAADQAEPRVMAYYLTELQSAGWKLVNHSAIAGYYRADFTKTGRGSIEVIVHEGFPNSGHHVLTLILDVEAVNCAGRTCVVPE